MWAFFQLLAIVFASVQQAMVWNTEVHHGPSVMSAKEGLIYQPHLEELWVWESIIQRY